MSSPEYFIHSAQLEKGITPSLDTDYIGYVKLKNINGGGTLSNIEFMYFKGYEIIEDDGVEVVKFHSFETEFAGKASTFFTFNICHLRIPEELEFMPYKHIPNANPDPSASDTFELKDYIQHDPPFQHYSGLALLNIHDYDAGTDLTSIAHRTYIKPNKHYIFDIGIAKNGKFGCLSAAGFDVLKGNKTPVFKSKLLSNYRNGTSTKVDNYLILALNTNHTPTFCISALGYHGTDQVFEYLNTCCKKLNRKIGVSITEPIIYRVMDFENHFGAHMVGHHGGWECRVPDKIEDYHDAQTTNRTKE